MSARCSVPGCKAETPRFDEWICSKHWGRLTKVERRVWARIKRRARRFGWEAVEDRAERIWAALVRRSA